MMEVDSDMNATCASALKADSAQSAAKAQKRALLVSNFNFKGGVSKTTTTFNLGWILSKLGKKVLLVDTDPQCNLTQVFTENNRNEGLFLPIDLNLQPSNLSIGHVIKKILHSHTLDVEAVETIPHHRNNELLLLPGHIEISMYETALAQAFLSRSVSSRHHISCLLEAIMVTAEANGVDIVLIDSSPSLSMTNNLLVMFSDFWIVPCQADFFSCKAVESMHSYIPEWIGKARDLHDLANENARGGFRLPAPNVKFIGGMVQMFTVQNGRPSNAHQDHINELSILLEGLGQILVGHGFALLQDDDVYLNLEIAPYILGQCQNFNRFAPMAQSARLPVAGLLDHHECIVAADNNQLTGVRLKTAVSDIARFIEPLQQVAEMFIVLLDRSTA